MAKVRELYQAVDKVYRGKPENGAGPDVARRIFNAVAVPANIQLAVKNVCAEANSFTIDTAYALYNFIKIMSNNKMDTNPVLDIVIPDSLLK
ncbi:MAG: hypothetical protein WCV50_04945 [Patescibacteria group bacterium]|jgi:hypothetical protein